MLHNMRACEWDAQYPELESGKKYQFCVGVVDSDQTGKRDTAEDTADDTAEACTCTSVSSDALHTEDQCSPPSDPFTVGYADTSLVANCAETSLGHASFTQAELTFFATLDTPGKVQVPQAWPKIKTHRGVLGQYT